MSRRALLLGFVVVSSQFAVGCHGRLANLIRCNHAGHPGHFRHHGGFVYTPDSPADCCAPGCGTCFKPDPSVQAVMPPVVMGTPVSLAAPIYASPIPSAPIQAPGLYPFATQGPSIAPPVGNPNPIGISEGVIPPMPMPMNGLPAPTPGKR